MFGEEVVAALRGWDGLFFPRTIPGQRSAGVAGGLDQGPAAQGEGHGGGCRDVDGDQHSGVAVQHAREADG